MWVFGGMVAGPGLLAAWEVYGEHMNREPEREPTPPPAPEEATPQEAVAPPSPQAVESVRAVRRMKTAAGLRGPVRRSRLEPVVPPSPALSDEGVDWEEDEDEQNTVLFKLNDAIVPEDSESVLIEE